MAKADSFPRLCFVGPMLGRNEGWVKTQGEILADLFTSSGYPVQLTSFIPNRALRMTDIIFSLIKWRKGIDIVNLSVFSGPGFVASDIASQVAKGLGKPLIFVLRGGNLPDFSIRHPQWVRRVFNRCDALISPSGFLAHFFREWGFDVKVIPNVIPIENYPFRLRQSVHPNLLWMRTFHPLYHPEMAVEVLKVGPRKISKSLPDDGGSRKRASGLSKVPGSSI